MTFGGADGKTLYLTCNTKVYSLAMTVSGGEHAVRAKRKAAKKKPKEFKATCPVLGAPAAQDAMVMYRGKKLYFCCQSCPDIFNVSPNVYSTAVHLQWIQSEQIEAEGPERLLSTYDGILVPGGFGERGIEGKVEAIRFARERDIPCLLYSSPSPRAKRLARMPASA